MEAERDMDLVFWTRLFLIFCNLLKSITTSGYKASEGKVNSG